MRPLRRKKKLHVTEGRDGGDRILNSMQRDDVLSDERSIDSLYLERTSFLDCGCNAEPAGRCFDCSAISCRVHHGICASCQKPICMEHSRFIETKNHESIRLCRQCYEKTQRKQIRKKVGRFFFSLIFEESRNG